LAELTRILGIDPGSRVTGYGVLDSDGTSTRYVASGCIDVAEHAFSARLEQIFTRVGELVDRYRPAHVAIENVFVHRNADSALKLGQARAAAICGTFGDRPELFEYAARQIKQAIVGRGGADKQQVQHMVRAILGLASLPGSDEADALAVAICHAHSRLDSRLRIVTGGVSALPRRRTGRSTAWRKVTR
jgi:crossover junction endodeoxyribonuclease RuvC